MNNAGIAPYDEFAEQDPHNLEKMYKINSLCPLYFTRAILPRLQEREQKSGIINVSSAASAFVLPGLLGYCMSKVFLSYFSRGLAFEMEKTRAKVEVLDYVPATVATSLSKAKEGIFAISA